MPGHYDGPPKPPAPKPPKRKPPKAPQQKFRSGASKGAKNIPFGSGDTENGSANADERYNPWGKGSKKNPTNASQTTGP